MNDVFSEMENYIKRWALFVILYHDPRFCTLGKIILIDFRVT